MITSKEIVIKTVADHHGEFAEVKNPAYVYPAVDYYPLAQKANTVPGIDAILMDMDGTTTTTELLCIYSLEKMVRRVAGNHGRKTWSGIDHHADLPFVIGNSTTKHVEYLLKKYGNLIDPASLFREFLAAACWTLTNAHDQQRKQEVFQNIRKLGINQIVDLIAQGQSPESILKAIDSGRESLSFELMVSMSIDIYYENYHRILALLKEGNDNQVQEMVFGSRGEQENLISPMPGMSVLIPLAKGWVGAEAALLAPLLASDYFRQDKESNGKSVKEIESILQRLGRYFEKKPAKLGLVTSSIFYEADIVVRQVLSVISETIANSALSKVRKEKILNAFKDYKMVYDAFVTASDSSEIRLKPHRDLYSIALHGVGVLPANFNKVIGLEDSQSGTVAIRAAGIGCCVAVPFAQTLSHDLSAAAHVIKGGVPEAIIDYGLFLQE